MMLAAARVRERPSGSCTAKKRDEVAPLRLAELHALPQPRECSQHNASARIKLVVREETRFQIDLSWAIKPSAIRILSNKRLNHASRRRKL